MTAKPATAAETAAKVSMGWLPAENRVVVMKGVTNSGACRFVSDESEKKADLGVEAPVECHNLAQPCLDLELIGSV